MLTTYWCRPIDILALMCTFDFLCDQFEREDLFVDVNIRPADIDTHFRIVLLIVKAIANDRIGVFSSVLSGPTRSGLKPIQNTLKRLNIKRFWVNLSVLELD